ncbi:hypothetical protein MRX96_036401 [Rhipicephalus microplus]
MDLPAQRPAITSVALISPGLQFTGPVLSANREGRTVTLRFGGPDPPRGVDTVQDALFCTAGPVPTAPVRDVWPVWPR